MHGEVLALTSAVCFGTSHFLSGVFSRRVNGLTVALYAQLGGTAVSLLVLPFATAAPFSAGAWAWAALSGVGTAVGVGFLFRAMGNGPMSVVVPLSDVGAVALPVLIGLAFLGERPAPVALAGIVLALPAIWLVSQGANNTDGTGSRGGIGHALIAGVGFAAHFLAISRIPVEAGLWPVALSRIVSVLALLPMVAAGRAPWRLPGRSLGGVLAAGAIGTAATLLYLAATHRQLMSVATVLAALYPAIPVVLGLVLLSERVNRRQVAGLLFAGAAIAMLALK
ncbi:DMT family transporter [Amycolatopsis nigrescens]|uniref:DMT family transporter n=1 Tax=Amycolatopsis nigrescens TaxID=381445 RepID=UPI00037A343D|nr:DMT family transporter [Amycolatopsis nigrescens]